MISVTNYDNLLETVYYNDNLIVTDKFYDNHIIHYIDKSQ